MASAAGVTERENYIVAEVSSILTDVPVEKIYNLIGPLTTIQSHDNPESNESAINKICNFLMEDNSADIRGQAEIMEVEHVNRTINLDFDSPSDDDMHGPQELDDLMTLAHRLGGTDNERQLDNKKNYLKSKPTVVVTNAVKNEADDDLPICTTPKRRKTDILMANNENGPIEIPDDVQPTIPIDKLETIAQDHLTISEVVEDIPMKEVVGDLMNLESVNAPSTIMDRTVTEMLECACCFDEFYFDYMVQCADGHLFCCQCLERYAQESVYGHGKGELKCMTDSCNEKFPQSQLCRAIPDILYKKLEERISEECLNIANLENFVRCKFCNYGAEIHPSQNFFNCPECQKNFCRKCKELFKDHEGLTCDQVEKDGETKIRTDYEEKMAQAKIRTCSKCKSPFTKDSGCNKITCRCGATMCYICRTPNIDYKHYCQHLRSPAKDCNKCKACFLWSNAEEDDKLAINEIKKEADKAREKEGFKMQRVIGAPADPATQAPVAHIPEALVENIIMAQAARRPRQARRARAAPGVVVARAQVAVQAGAAVQAEDVAIIQALNPRRYPTMEAQDRAILQALTVRREPAAQAQDGAIQQALIARREAAAHLDAVIYNVATRIIPEPVIVKTPVPAPRKRAAPRKKAVVPKGEIKNQPIPILPKIRMPTNAAAIHPGEPSTSGAYAFSQNNIANNRLDINNHTSFQEADRVIINGTNIVETKSTTAAAPKEEFLRVRKYTKMLMLRNIECSCQALEKGEYKLALNILGVLKNTVEKDIE